MHILHSISDLKYPGHWLQSIAHLKHPPVRMDISVSINLFTADKLSWDWGQQSTACCAEAIAHRCWWVNNFSSIFYMKFIYLIWVCIQLLQLDKLIEKTFIRKCLVIILFQVECARTLNNNTRIFISHDIIIQKNTFI